jgi:hypothetical protein
VHRDPLLWAIPALGMLAGVLAASSSAPPQLPAIVFAARAPLREAGAVPGLGPHHRAAAPGGRLMVRERSGVVRPLLPHGALFDVSDPAVSFDGRRIAFAGTPAPDSAWRIYVVGSDGSGLRAVTRSDPMPTIAALGAAAERSRRFDDLDPCWVDDAVVCFASTRYPQRAQYADLPVSNLFLVNVETRPRSLRSRDGPVPLAPGTPLRITAERNGAEEPALDPRTGRLVYARWWFNRHRPGAEGRGLAATAAGRMQRDSVNLWQPIAITPLGRDPRLAGGLAAARREAMAYQPAVLRDGALLGVYASNLGLSPRPGGLGVQRLARGGTAARRLAGAIVALAGGDPYSAASGLAAPAACAPAVLPDGSVLLSYDPGGRGDLGLYRMRPDGSDLMPVVDLPGTLELDAAPIVARRRPALALEPIASRDRAPAVPAVFLSSLPPVTDESLERRGTFRFLSLDVFGGARRRAGAAAAGPLPRTPGVRIRFWALFARPGAEGGDTAVLLRERPVAADGSVDERLPADVPMFEQLVDSAGTVLRSAHEPAHVAGLNAGIPGSVARCIGCHVGHSTLPLR